MVDDFTVWIWKYQNVPLNRLTFLTGVFCSLHDYLPIIPHAFYSSLLPRYRTADVAWTAVLTHNRCMRPLEVWMEVLIVMMHRLQTVESVDGGFKELRLNTDKLKTNLEMKMKINFAELTLWGTTYRRITDTAGCVSLSVSARCHQLSVQFLADSVWFSESLTAAPALTFISILTTSQTAVLTYCGLFLQCWPFDRVSTRFMLTRLAGLDNKRGQSCHGALTVLTL